MKQQALALAALTLSATVVLAHGGVKNPAVMARMNGMSAIADNMKILGGMAKGASPFDVGAAQRALQSIADHASHIPVLFEAQEEDPKSEAKSEIWGSFADFTAKSNELRDVAADLANSLVRSKDLPAAMQLLGSKCQSCHSAYRTEK